MTRKRSWEAARRVYTVEDGYRIPTDWINVTVSEVAVNEQLQLCRRCTVEQPLREFNRDERRSNGYRTICRTCMKADRKTAKLPAPPTPEEEAYQEATAQLIELHRGHFDKLVYSLKVRKGLVVPRGVDETAVERRRIYAVGANSR